MFHFQIFKKSVFAAIFSFAILGFGAIAHGQEVSLNPGESWSGNIPTASVLSLDGRIVFSKPAGGNYILQIGINDKDVVSPLTNKGQSFQYQDGRKFNYKLGNAWMLFYSADFSANNTTAGGGYQVMTEPGQAYHYSWDISSLAGTASEMKVTIKNVSPTYPIVGRLTSATAFPAKELGNCGSQAACKAYCDKSENISVCASYAEQHGLLSKEEAARAKEFADVLRGEGPGGCKDQKSCESYCNGTAHLNECVGFAEKHNLIPADQLKEAKQILNAIGQGGKLPGNCTDKKSCESYCADLSHGGECVDFAEKAGFMSAKDAEEARKVLPFVASGETPGGCKTKEQCEKYCDNEGNITECVGFAEKAGLMSSEEAAMVKKTGGKGPGGCRSKEDCDSYCNQPANQEACFNFAVEHDLIPADKLKEMKDGMGRLRAGITQMPAPAVSCLKEKLGEDVISKIEDGTFMPGPNTGGMIQSCVAKAMPEIKAKLEEGLKNATPEVRDCLNKGLGEGGLDKVLSGGEMTPDSGDVFRGCFESMKVEGLKKMREGLGKMPPEMRSCIEDKLGKDLIGKVESVADVELGPETAAAFQECAGSATQIMDKMLEQAPAEMRDCIKQKIGTDLSNIKGQEDVQGFINECMKNFIPKGIPSGAIPEGYGPGSSDSGAPTGIPSGDSMGIENYRPAGVPSSESESEKSMPPAGMMPSAGQIPASVCEAFKAAPSCDYVPESARDICKQCKGE